MTAARDSAPANGRAAVRMIGSLPDSARGITLCVPTVASRPPLASWLVPAVRCAAPAAELDVLLGPDEGVDDLLPGWGPVPRVRVLPTEVPLLMVADDEVVLADGGTAAVAPAAPYRVMVGALWEAARPLPAPRPDGAPAAVLELLASGVTDRVGARRLGVSERTYRRLVAELMVRLGARSRFEAGMLATTGGWLEIARQAAGG